MSYYYEGNYYRGIGSDGIYAIMTIEEGDFSIDEYVKEFGEQGIEFDEGSETGKFKVEFGSNWCGTEEVAFVDTLEEAKEHYARMEESHCEGMSFTGKPLEDMIIAGEKIPTGYTDKQLEVMSILRKHIDSGNLVEIPK